MGACGLSFPKSKSRRVAFSATAKLNPGNIRAPLGELKVRGALRGQEI